MATTVYKGCLIAMRKTMEKIGIDKEMFEEVKVALKEDYQSGERVIPIPKCNHEECNCFYENRDVVSN